MAHLTIARLSTKVAQEFALDRASVGRLLACAGIPPERALAHPDEPVDAALVQRVRGLARRLSEREPFAYLTGRAGFFRREFFVDSRVLIPRPETEHLVEAAIAYLREREAPRVLDLGTGSGAIACTIAAELPHARVDAVDISDDALAVARINAEALGARVCFHKSDLFAALGEARYDAIVANLPYVPDGAGEESLRFEPALALYAGPDGLDLYRRCFAHAPSHLVAGGILLAEGAPPIADGLLSLARAAFEQASVSLHRDYGGRERFVKVVTPG